MSGQPLAASSGDWEAIPAELRERRQWVGWRLRQRPGAPKPTKQPLNPRDGALASTTDPATWGTFEEALKCPGTAGVGFVFTRDDPYVGIDLDGCRNPETGALEKWAADIVAQLASYTEVSPSGTGVHVIVRGSLPGTRRRKGPIEMYAEGRYFTMTGNRLADTPQEIAERSAELNALHEGVFEENAAADDRPKPIHARLTDDELVRRAQSAANGAKFLALWSGDVTGYDSQSEADLALCGLLAFWTGPDQARIDRLFHQSGLMRPKWDERHGATSYGERTIATALAGRSEFYDPMRPVEPGDGPPQLALTRFMETDAGNAEAFASMYRDKVVFDHRLKRWLIRGEHRWIADHVSEVRLLAKDVARRRLRAAAELVDEDRRKKSVRHALSSESRQRLDAMIELAKAEPGIADAGESWDADPNLIATENGVVDLAAGVLRPGRPDERITLAVTVPYRPEAECPRWERFLHEIFRGDEALIAFMQRAIGYSLTGDVTEHALFLLFGTGRNGKSVLLNTLRRLAADYALNLPFSAFELIGRSQLTPELALLPGKRLVTSSETNDGARLNEARIKAMTGADPITANPKYATPFEFTPVAKFWLAVNHLPVVHDDSEGFWRRVKLIRFERIFTESERDPFLEQRLAEELPGILAWAVRGALDWKERGLDPPRSVVGATDSYRTESDPLADFIATRCVMGDALTVSAGALYLEYAAWTDALGMPVRERLTTTAFGRRIGERFAKKPTNRGKVYSGIGLRAQRDGDGFAESDGFDGHLQELSLDHSREEKFQENPSQPVTFPTCDDGCGTPVVEAGELCDACAEAALQGDPL